MKFNWGHKLVFFMVLFMLFIITLVTLMIKQHVPLVETDYYEKGIHYDDELRKHRNTKGLDHKIVYNATKQQLVFSSAIGGEVTGVATFYRPSDNTMDFKQSFQLNEYGACTLSTDKMNIGLWRVTFEWVLQNDTFASSKDIFIQ